ncbi:MAG: glycosyltransferase [Lachnospira sp.]
MNGKVKVSVLVPIYNVEKYLPKCLDSLCAQTLKDIEFICINDGSTDNSGVILQEYAKKDSRFKVINKSNSGYGDSMNVGLNEATGEFIGIVESDDFAEPDMFEKLYSLADDNQLDIVKSNCFFYSTKDGAECNEKVDVFDELPVNQVFCPMDKPSLFWKLQTIWSAIYRKEYIVDNNIQFNNTPGASYQDVSFVFQNYACADRMMLVSDAYLHYRIDNMASSVNNPTKVFCICDELEYIRSFINRYESAKSYKLSLYASRLGYRILKENVDNLGSAFQYALFCRMIEYFKEYREKGYLEAPYEINGCTIWEENQIADINEILLNPNKYFLSHSKSFEDNRVYNYVLNRKIYVREVLRDIISHNKIVIYGAGIIGKELLSYLISGGVDKSKIEFAVSDKSNNPDSIDDIKVNSIEDISRQMNSDAAVVIAVKEQMQYDICVKLDKLGITNVYSIDSEIREVIRATSD